MYNKSVFNEASQKSHIHKQSHNKLIFFYHPISLLTSMSKINKKNIVLQCSDYLYQNCIKTPRKFGFSSQVSTEIAVSSSMNAIYDDYCNNFSIIKVLLNLKNVFEAVNISSFLQNSFIMEYEFQLVSQLFIEPPTFYFIVLGYIYLIEC